MATAVKSVKVPPSLAHALARLAEQRGQSESELIREGIERIVAESDGLDMVKLLGADVGVGHGPHDLSSQRKRMTGYGRARTR